jgi:hypothetical protein
VCKSKVEVKLTDFIEFVPSLRAIIMRMGNDNMKIFIEVRQKEVTVLK